LCYHLGHSWIALMMHSQGPRPLPLQLSFIFRLLTCWLCEYWQETHFNTAPSCCESLPNLNLTGTTSAPFEPLVLLASPPKAGSFDTQKAPPPYALLMTTPTQKDYNITVKNKLRVWNRCIMCAFGWSGGSSLLYEAMRLDTCFFHQLGLSTTSGSVSMLHLMGEVRFCFGWSRCEKLVFTMGARQDQWHCNNSICRENVTFTWIVDFEGWWSTWFKSPFYYDRATCNRTI